MIPVVGLPLPEAEQRLREAGFQVTSQEISAKKKLPGNDFRVIAVKTEAENSMRLEYAAFLTDLSKQ